jgi:SpoVK/Ycf46/Vps4 family AAA+-type ATPase
MKLYADKIYFIMTFFKRKNIFCQYCNIGNCYGNCRSAFPKRQFSIKKQKINIIKAPLVNNIKDLIMLAEKENTLYTNINTKMLKNIKNELKKLDSLIGMNELKDTIFEQVLHYLQGMHKVGQSDYLNTCIMGDPGTGKTTVAQIIANIYKNSGVLSPNGIFKIGRRSEMIGGYLGQTSINTQKILTECIGGVLFIDEIYSFGNGESNTDTYSKECIDCINQFMSEHKNDFCLIVAGYEKEIEKCFLSVNEGLTRRFNWKHVIKKYNEKELAEISEKMLKDIGWKTNVTNKELKDIIKKEIELFKHAGGSVENWISKVKLAHSRRVFPLDYQDKYVLSLDDFKEGLKRLKKNEVNETDILPPPLEMYM